MCGIAGAFLRDPEFAVNLDSVLDTMLDCIEHRGGDATGYLALDSNGVAEWHRAACDVGDFKKYRRPVPSGTRTMLAHTRYATQGLPAFIENNHPLRRGPFYVIHNGHVSNDQELFKLSGRRPYGQVDSEAIAARLASLGSLLLTNRLMEEIEGAAAIAAVDETAPDQLVLAKGHSSPLFVLVTNKIVLWGSTKLTVEKAYKAHIGRVPRKRGIEELKAGEGIFFQGKKQTRFGFKPYAPRYTYKPSSYVWKETTEPKGSTHLEMAVVDATRHLPTVGGWPKWDAKDAHEFSDLEVGADVAEDELVLCEACGHGFPWRETVDTNYDGQWFTVCEDCDESRAVARLLDPEGDRGSDDFDIVNAAVLSAGEDASEEG